MQKTPILATTLLVIALFLILQFVTWGTLVIRPPQTITVTGMAESQEQNQVGSFYAGAQAVNQDKQAAIDEVNTKVNEAIAKLQEFGLDKADIQTSSLGVYQEQEQYTENGVQRFRPGNWRANNSLTIKLRDIDRASELVDMLAATGLTDVSGPSFMLDNTSEAQTALLTAAVDNAKEKAELLAQQQGKKVYKVLSIAEGTTQPGLYPLMDSRGYGGGGTPVEPGSTTVTTTVTVSFELR